MLIPAYGGAIDNLGTCWLTNNTLVNNSAVGGDGTDAYGGAFYNDGGSVTVVNNSFVSNAAMAGTGYGGAICNSNGTVTLYNTILASSTSGSNCFGVLVDSGYNLSSDASAGFSAPGSLNNTDPLLGTLGNYGGPTPTLALLAGSPAIDAIPAALAPATDQRGFSRPYGTASDIGAFEWTPLYFISGKVSGLPSANGVVITAGTNSMTLTNAGYYLLSNLAPGSYVVTPSNPHFAFVPNSRSVTLGPDQTNVDFEAYGWNTIGVEGISDAALQLRYVGTNGQTYRVLTATNLTGPWLPVATNTLVASNYFDLYLPLSTEPGRFYRTVSP